MTSSPVTPVIIKNTRTPKPSFESPTAAVVDGAADELLDETVAQVEVLIKLRDSTGYEGWTKNKEGWDQLVAGMSGKQAKAIFEACNNRSVGFDDEERLKKISLGKSGLSGDLDSPAGTRV